MKPYILTQNINFDVPVSLTNERNYESNARHLIQHEQITTYNFPALIELAQSNGHQHLDNAHFVALFDSVGCHVDDSPYDSITIACLAHDEGSFYGTTELITTHGGLNLQLGDVFIFDRSEWHAWISYGLAIIACVF